MDEKVEERHPSADNGDLEEGESRVHRLRFAVAVALPFLLLASGLLWLQIRRDQPAEIRIATGSRSGTYHPYGQALGGILEREVGASVEVLETAGSVANVRLLADRAVDLAFLQSNVLSSTPRGEAADVDSDAVASFRTVARLYEEVLQIVARKDADARTLRDLDGGRVFVGAPSSGTAETSALLFEHFGIRPRFDHEDRVEERLSSGELDAAVFVAGLKTQAVGKLLATGRMKLVPVGEVARGSAVEGACLSLPGTRPGLIPRGTYGTEPSQAVATLAVDALLVTRADVAAHLVRRTTELLFANKFRLARAHPAASDLAELQDSRGLRFSLHPGAANYYARNEPPFFVTHADALSLALTLLLTVGSGGLAVREWTRRRKKNRIDVFYVELDRLSRQIRRSRAAEELMELRQKLYRLRRRAFHELVAERIEADESFTIFQDFLGQELREVDRWLDRGERVDNPAPSS